MTETQDMEVLRNAFDLFDTDNDGTITRAELRAVMLRHMGQEATDIQLQNLIRKVDKNDNGSIDFDEFVELMSSGNLYLDVDAEKEMELTFKVFDEDGNGKISRGEVKNIMEAMMNVKLTEEELDELIKEADENSDGEISLPEFKKVMGFT